jgi:hypothetical protein
VAVDRAVEGVGAGLEVDLGRGLAVRDDLGATELALTRGDRDVVLDRRRVVEVDRHLAGLGGERGLVELELARIGGDLDRGPAPAAAGA